MKEFIEWYVGIWRQVSPRAARFDRDEIIKRVHLHCDDFNDVTSHATVRIIKIIDFIIRDFK